MISFQDGKPALWRQRVLFLLRRREKWQLILFMVFYTPLFLLIFQPFGVNNYDPTHRIDPAFLLAALAFGLVNGLILAGYEFGLAPLLFRQPNWPVFAFRIFLELCLLGAGNFLFYNILVEFHDWRLSSFIGFLRDTSLIYLIPLAMVFLYFNYLRMRKALEVVQVEPKPFELENRLVRLQSDNGKEHLAVDLENLLFIEAQGNYVFVYYLDKGEPAKSLLRTTMKKLEEQLKGFPVIRCHRSYLVNLQQVVKVSGNAHQMILHLGKTDFSIPVSRSYVPGLEKRLDGHPV